jgi:hypothetical protein
MTDCYQNLTGALPAMCVAVLAVISMLTHTLLQMLPLLFAPLHATE